MHSSFTALPITWDSPNTEYASYWSEDGSVLIRVCRCLECKHWVHLPHTVDECVALRVAATLTPP